MTSKEALKARIEEAFGVVQAPDRNDITTHDCSECNRVRDDFSMHLDREVPEEVLNYHKDSLALLSPRAFVFFLPVYLLWSIDSPDSALTDYTIYGLIPFDLESPYWRDRLELLSRAQKSTICSWLSHLEQQDDCRYSLDEIRRAKAIWCTSTSPMAKK